MEPKRQREIVLAVVTLLLAIAAYTAYQTMSNGAAPSVAATASSNGEGKTARRGAPAAANKPDGPEAPDVHLDALSAGRPKPDPGGRDLFRYKPKPPPPPPPPPRLTVGPNPPPPPPVPPPPPPITLKFIGFVDSETPGKRIAFLSDGRGAPLSGHEGDTVLGQYRILRIGPESIEMAYLDGRGRQTIRLSGS